MKYRYDKILSDIKQILAEEDLMGLIKGCGAPEDEYDGEGEMIFERVNRYDTIDQITDKIWDVFYLQFCFGTVYKEIDGELKEIYKEPISRGRDAEKQIGNKNKYLSSATKIQKIFNLDKNKPKS